MTGEKEAGHRSDKSGKGKYCSWEIYHFCWWCATMKIKCMKHFYHRINREGSNLLTYSLVDGTMVSKAKF